MTSRLRIIGNSIGWLSSANKVGVTLNRVLIEWLGKCGDDFSRYLKMISEIYRILQKNKLGRVFAGFVQK